VGAKGLKIPVYTSEAMPKDCVYLRALPPKLIQEEWPEGSGHPKPFEILAERSGDNTKFLVIMRYRKEKTKGM
jgi:hypothetical protein